MIHDGNPDDEFTEDAYADRKIALRDCIKKLSERQQSLIKRRYLTGASIDELADELAQNRQTIVQVLYRARRNLMTCVKKNLPQEGMA